MQDISPEELSEQLRNDDAAPLVLDSQNEAEFAEWHIPDSINVDVYEELTGDPEQANDALSEFPDDEQASVPADELAELELLPTNCAAE
ncbi:rhodanese-like domain-containing protein [Salinibaculum rarum]|uniref:rhodanese-like domain-containing protein n=1 Tax=Salinibaculum rarum TaxID=3058903 RepID=UPI002660072D|nr:rhodanese-like domain-containing protein [Salinibaculum sp. KK48]